MNKLSSGRNNHFNDLDVVFCLSKAKLVLFPIRPTHQNKNSNKC